ncbi:MMPL family transporter [Micromonospora echinofusca]|uniref:MMPL family transporter n=1 Tax=Micromonospora echinofusca TaxID=47858 RepID=UPI0027DDB9BB|nr:MMPL family transporter [Micromonospora echinofusca]
MTVSAPTRPATDRPTGDDLPPVPTGPLARLGATVVRYRRATLVLSLLFTLLAAGLSWTVSDRLVNGGYIPQDAESQRAARFLADSFGAGTADLVLVLTADRPADDPTVADAGTRLTSELDARTDTAAVQSWWNTGEPALRSTDGRSALILVRLVGAEDERQGHAKELMAELDRRDLPFSVQATGESQVNREIIEQSEQDLIRAELIVTPLTLLILLLVFGSVVAASLPAVVGAIAVLGSLAVLTPLAEITNVSVFALNVATALGFGLAVDYSLFIVTRYREELALGRDSHQAVVVAVVTAGRTVLFSACTVALSMCGLLVYPLFFLRSLAYSGILVVGFGALAAVVVLPAVLAVLGPKVFRWSLPWARADRDVRAAGFWSALARTVMRRPVLTAGPVMLLLVALALPFTQVRFGLADANVLPADAPAARAANVVERDFDAHAIDALTVALPGGTADARLDSYVQRISALPHVTHVDAPTGRYADGAQAVPATPAHAAMVNPDGVRLNVVLDVDPFSAAGERVVAQVRDLPGPVPALVGGPSATLVDTKGVVGGMLPWALAIVGVSTFILLFLFTGGLLVPVKALVLNLLSLTATFGVMVYVFQDGHLKWLVGDFTATGYLEVTIPVLAFCIAFGLSMDYEVFMLSRMREEYVRHGDNERAVAVGLARTGRLISAAAVIVASVMVALATSQLSLLKLLGVALALAVVTDALLVRAVLVPAFMRLAGRANWWAPGPLARLHRRIGLRDS